MTRPIAYMLIAAVFAFGALPADAAKLTSKQIIGSTAAMPEIEKLSKKYKMDDDKKKNPGEVSMDFEKEFYKSLKELRAKGGYGEAKGIVRKHGFSSPEHWLGITVRVMKAYMALTMRQAGSKAQIKQSMAMIQGNAQFPAAQKKKMMAQMRAILKMMDDLEKVPAADKAAVKPHVAALTQMMKGRQEAGMAGGGMSGGRRR